MSRGERRTVAITAAVSIGCTLSILAVAPVAHGGSAIADVVRARSFEVVDGAGQSRARIAVDTRGRVSISLLDGTGANRMLLAVDVNGSPGIHFVDGAGVPRVSLGILSDQPMLTLFDAMGKKRLGMAVLPAGSAGLSIFDANERMRATFLRASNGTSSVSFFDANTKPRDLLGIGDDGTPILLFADSSGTPFKTMP